MTTSSDVPCPLLDVHLTCVVNAPHEERVCCVVFSRYPEFLPSPTTYLKEKKSFDKISEPAASSLFQQFWHSSGFGLLLSVVFWLGRPLFGIIISFISFYVLTKKRRFEPTICIKMISQERWNVEAMPHYVFVSWFRLRQRLETFLWKTDFVHICVASGNFGCVCVSAFKNRKSQESCFRHNTHSSL